MCGGRNSWGSPAQEGIVSSSSTQPNEQAEFDGARCCGNSMELGAAAAVQSFTITITGLGSECSFQTKLHDTMAVSMSKSGIRV
jgi:hypothetical protein